MSQSAFVVPVARCTASRISRCERVDDGVYTALFLNLAKSASGKPRTAPSASPVCLMLALVVFPSAPRQIVALRVLGSTPQRPGARPPSSHGPTATDTQLLTPSFSIKSRTLFFATSSPFSGISSPAKGSGPNSEGKTGGKPTLAAARMAVAPGG